MMSHLSTNVEQPKMTVAGFDLPALSPTHKMQRVLLSALKQQSVVAVESLVLPPWGASFFSLDRVPLFQQSTVSDQTQILQLACQGVLTESYAIEKAGVGYMSKMALLAETMEERMLYALFSADEAMHLAQLKPLMSLADTLVERDPFLQLLESLLETAHRSVLLFVIQVVLEGWGLSHYRNLSKHCRNPMMADLFKSFLQAEAKHHGAGVVLFDRANLSAENRAAIVDAIAAFLQMVRVGPQRLVSSIAAVKGDLSRSQTIGLLKDLDTESHSGTRLNLLRSLILPVDSKIAETLDKKGLFVPLPPAQCVCRRRLSG